MTCDPQRPALRARLKEAVATLRAQAAGDSEYVPNDILAEDLRLVLAELAALSEAHARWRSWAQFVYLGGGAVPEDADDKDLQRRVCESQDADLAALRERLTEVEQERDSLTSSYNELCDDRAGFAQRLAVLRTQMAKIEQEMREEYATSPSMIGSRRLQHYWDQIASALRETEP